jgi:hypothetical protein
LKGRFRLWPGRFAYLSQSKPQNKKIRIEKKVMNNKFDELAKNLAQSITRRGALKKFGIGLTGAPASGLVEFWDLFPIPGLAFYRTITP